MVLTKSETGSARQAAKTAPDPSAKEAQTRRAETAAYIAELASTLASLARVQNFDALAYLFDQARLEAEGLSQPPALRSSQ
jgi:hypothetical protein